MQEIKIYCCTSLRFCNSECSAVLTVDTNSQDAAFPISECNIEFHLVLGLKLFSS